MSVRVGKCVGRDDIGDNAKRELATSAIGIIHLAFLHISLYNITCAFVS